MECLKIIQLNICGIKHKINDLKCLVSENSPDVICLNETSLSSKSLSPKLKGFVHYRLDRSSYGGGVLLYIKNNIKHNNIEYIDIEGHEIIQCKVYKNNNSQEYINISTIYVPPQNNINLELITLINQDNSIILGDLNCKHLKWGCLKGNKNGNKLYKSLYDCG